MPYGRNISPILDLFFQSCSCPLKIILASAKYSRKCSTLTYSFLAGSMRDLLRVQETYDVASTEEAARFVERIQGPENPAAALPHTRFF
jgi:hypothetical protein